MSFDRNKNYYNYEFSNGERHTMTPIDAHKYANKHKIDIFNGPGYIKAKKEKDWDGFGFHSGLQMSFKGPRHYREYLKEHGMVEASVNDKPTEGKYQKPIWDEALIRRCINEYKIDIGSVLAEALLSGELDYPEDGMQID